MGHAQAKLQSQASLHFNLVKHETASRRLSFHVEVLLNLSIIFMQSTAKLYAKMRDAGAARSFLVFNHICYCFVVLPMPLP